MVTGDRARTRRRPCADVPQLHLERDERSRFDAARQIVTRRRAAPPTRRCGRERPDRQAPVRVRDAQLTVGRADLVGVGHALRRLRTELRLGRGENGVEQLRRHRGRRAYTAPASSEGAIGNARWAAIGPASSSATVRWIVTRSPNRPPGSPARPAPRRQRGRRMDVEPEPALEQLCRNQEPVRDDHDRAGPDVDLLGAARAGERDASRSAASFTEGAGRRPRPLGASGRVSNATTSWEAASRASTSAPNARRRGDGDASHAREANGGAGQAGGARAPRAANRRRCAGG